MKYKTQDEESTRSPMLEDIVDLLIVNKEFVYMVSCYSKNKNKNNFKLDDYCNKLKCDFSKLFKLAISLDPKHIGPTLNVELKPFESIDDLKDYEEKYYNMLKEIAKNAFEEKEIETMSYLFDIIRNFEHYFCTLDESNISRETSSQ